MNYDVNEFWKKVSPGLRRYLKLTPPTLSEAEAEFNAAKEAALSEDQIQSILHYAKTSRRQERRPKRALPDWLKNLNLTQISQDMVPALARNAGVKDKDVEDLLDRLRKEALETEVQDADGEEQSEIHDKAEPREEGN